MEGPLIVVLTRFSIYDYPPKISSGNLRFIKTEEDYKQWLYGKERMESKFDYFEKLTVPSIQHQTYKNIKWILFTSDTMPPHWLKRLQQNLKSIEGAEIRFVKSIKECTNPLGITEPYISVRLDDDDGLHPKLFELYSHFKQKGLVLSPKGGLVVSEKAGRWITKSQFTYPTCGAWGLGLVGGNVLALGNHMNIHKKLEKHKLRYLSEPDLYLRSDVRKGNVTRRNPWPCKSAKPFDLTAYFKAPPLKTRKNRTRE